MSYTLGKFHTRIIANHCKPIKQGLRRVYAGHVLYDSIIEDQRCRSSTLQHFSSNTRVPQGSHKGSTRVPQGPRKVVRAFKMPFNKVARAFKMPSNKYESHLFNTLNHSVQKQKLTSTQTFQNFCESKDFKKVRICCSGKFKNLENLFG